jgi:hypothetical protein
VKIGEITEAPGGSPKPSIVVHLADVSALVTWSIDRKMTSLRVKTCISLLGQSLFALPSFTKCQTAPRTPERHPFSAPMMQSGPRVAARHTEGYRISNALRLATAVDMLS